MARRSYMRNRAKRGHYVKFADGSKGIMQIVNNGHIQKGKAIKMRRAPQTISSRPIFP